MDATRRVSTCPTRSTAAIDDHGTARRHRDRRVRHRAGMPAKAEAPLLALARSTVAPRSSPPLPKSRSTARTSPATTSSSRAPYPSHLPTSAIRGRHERTRAVTFPMSRSLLSTLAALPATRRSWRLHRQENRCAGALRSVGIRPVAADHGDARHPRAGRALRRAGADRGPRPRRPAGARDRHARRDLAGGVLADYGRLSARTVVTGDDGIARAASTRRRRHWREPVDLVTIVTLLVTPDQRRLRRIATTAASRSGWCRRRRTGHHPAQRGPGAVVHRDADAGDDLHAGDVRRLGHPRRRCVLRRALHLCVGLRRRLVGHRHGDQPRVPHRRDVQRAPDRDRRPWHVGDHLAVDLVTATAAPKADFTFSPSGPRFGQEVFFNASASTAAPGHRIVAYDWDFGTDRIGTVSPSPNATTST